MKKLLYIFFTLTITYSVAHCQDNTKFSVLFVFNSLTYFNNLPGLVKKSAKREAIKITAKMIAFPNYVIEDHWNDGQVQKLISTKKYDFVIIQQVPSSQKDGRSLLM